MSLNSSSIWLPRSRRAPAEARRRLSGLLAGAPDGDRFLDSGLLAVTELVTNAVVHGTPAGYLIYLAFDVTPARLRIEVHDARGDREPVLSPPGLNDEAGRGLQLVNAVAQSWGCCPRRPIGKITWCEVVA
ncbi:ATP-binding protein [Kitasatospora aureofaciens]|uniref:ATP-binding protein n=1 Tax=Kitasatospora aureofaciens TaxID=1894 RepID=UPI001C488167|nr:ATP-binding protein [Kitasatospora aureofaciens]MBV6699849.1 ATP-binding protein [Kitasatospora aureofaciens]